MQKAGAGLYFALSPFPKTLNITFMSWLMREVFSEPIQVVLDQVKHVFLTCPFRADIQISAQDVSQAGLLTFWPQGLRFFNVQA